MPPSRKDAWLRDEIILALDLYRREGRNPSEAGVAEVSDLLRSIPIESHLAEAPTFRNRTGVRLKVSNFVALDPGAETAGMSRGSRLDKEVFDEYWPQPARLTEAAEAIKAHLEAVPEAGADEDEELEDAPEGRILTRTHRLRERNRRLVRRKKEKVLAETGSLACEACGFDFHATYGERGSGFIECHHVVPVRDLRPGARTRLKDLSLLCANCHRMIHVRSPWLTVEQLREQIPPWGSLSGGGSPFAPV